MNFSLFSGVHPYGCVRAGYSCYSRVKKRKQCVRITLCWLTWTVHGSTIQGGSILNLVHSVYVVLTILDPGGKSDFRNSEWLLTNSLYVYITCQMFLWLIFNYRQRMLNYDDAYKIWKLDCLPPCLLTTIF